MGAHGRGGGLPQGSRGAGLSERPRRRYPAAQRAGPERPRPQGGERERLSERPQGGERKGPSEVGGRVCRVVPDVPAVDRAFDYLVPAEVADRVRVGTIVRVPLHGRRVRGWVVEDDVAPQADPEALLALLAVVSAGPPADLVALAAWAAWRWAGPRCVFLRAASPPNIVGADDQPERRVAVFPTGTPPLELPGRSPSLGAWPPAVDRVDLVQSLLSADGSTIVVAPDGRELSRLERAFVRDGRDVVSLRGDAPAASRTEQWREARAGACVVVGGRIAAFAPVPDLRAVVVLDDADEALQEERAPTWHSRELLVERGRRADAQVTLVTPMPTVEGTALAGPPVRPPRNTERAGWPLLEIVDRRDNPPGAGIGSPALGPALHRALDAGTRALCVLNRRGRARLVACRTCREIARCGRCGAAVAEVAEGLACPRCGEARPSVCLVCGGQRFHAVRPGVGRAREAIAGLVPRARVAALEAGTSDAPDADVVVGTEAAFHRFPPDDGAVGLVAFLDFDQELLAARYRAAEQALWLLVRAARTVGPRRAGGRVLVQTRLPDHEVLRAAREADPAIVTEIELGRRRALALPPFGGLAELSGAPEAVARACDALRMEADVRGPVDGRALVRAPSVDALCAVLDRVDLAPARALGRLRVAVDPPRV